MKIADILFEDEVDEEPLDHKLWDKCFAEVQAKNKDYFMTPKHMEQVEKLYKKKGGKFKRHIRKSKGRQLKKGDVMKVHGFVMLKNLNDGKQYVITKIEKTSRGEVVYFKPKRGKKAYWWQWKKSVKWLGVIFTLIWAF